MPAARSSRSGAGRVPTRAFPICATRASVSRTPRQALAQDDTRSSGTRTGSRPFAHAKRKPSLARGDCCQSSNPALRVSRLTASPAFWTTRPGTTRSAEGPRCSREARPFSSPLSGQVSGLHDPQGQCADREAFSCASACLNGGLGHARDADRMDDLVHIFAIAVACAAALIFAAMAWAGHHQS